MNYSTAGLIASLTLFLGLAGSSHAAAATASAGAADGTPTLVTELLFNSTASTGQTEIGNGTPMAMISTGSTSALNVPGWTFDALKGAMLTVQPTPSPTSTGGTVDALEGSYPVAGVGSNYLYAAYNMANLNTEDVYIEFWARMPESKGGDKFVKIFGQRTDTTGYANTTIGTNYTGGDYGSIPQVLFGDGTTIVNDVQQVINLNGQKPQLIGRSYGTAVVQTPQMSAFTSADWGTTWHHFLIHVKFNSGTSLSNETPDGEVFLEIDGKVYVDATGLFNRNPANGPIGSISFFGWAQGDPEPFQLWYYDIRISTGGFISQPLPDPPANVAVN